MKVTTAIAHRWADPDYEPDRVMFHLIAQLRPYGEHKYLSIASDRNEEFDPMVFAKGLRAMADAIDSLAEEAKWEPKSNSNGTGSR